MSAGRSSSSEGKSCWCRSPFSVWSMRSCSGHISPISPPLSSSDAHRHSWTDQFTDRKISWSSVWNDYRTHFSLRESMLLWTITFLHCSDLSVLAFDIMRIWFMLAVWFRCDLRMPGDPSNARCEDHVWTIYGGCVWNSNWAGQGQHTILPPSAEMPSLLFRAHSMKGYRIETFYQFNFITQKGKQNRCTVFAARWRLFVNDKCVALSFPIFCHYWQKRRRFGSVALVVME